MYAYPMRATYFIVELQYETFFPRARATAFVSFKRRFQADLLSRLFFARRAYVSGCMSAFLYSPGEREHAPICGPRQVGFTSGRTSTVCKSDRSRIVYMVSATAYFLILSDICFESFYK